MSGHSKWAGIKHKKAVVDAKRGQAFTRASRELTIAAREGGGNPDGNFRLRLAMQKAREINMPTDKIQNAIKRGTGELAGERLEEIRYEGYGPAGVAVMVDALTDNRNRTSASIRHRLSKLGGNLGESNSVNWMFERKGVISANAGKADPEEVGLAAIEAGADDVQVEGKSVEITAPPSVFEKVKAAVEALGVTVENAEITMQPKQTVPIGEDKAAAVLRLMESLEEDEDVQQVYANFDIPTDVLERVSAQV
ncbi:MAG: transcriptional regulator [Chloroflexi bacterium 13_1_40CM_4_65_16]|nr:MAG: transcriptional regulator [Chloroflexi bacterium 13_1_40CM_66_19]OLC49840.1 MAG: transcriptional regulator [Chloroflexi bacterium 13_1_40CM_4_65_16]OLD06230.1 MAG: transcriptional regulator [Actinobacteria bacterium 13_1_40CM_3_66_19]OLD54205.1 MAG: transcriptional regulator [Actinobacteria bacterium 13_1_40CM_2_66_13]TMF41117.1 MAG: YebC/PmpR family DNA-binding transcriptional regulator [Chloroflexota bacterium]